MHDFASFRASAIRYWERRRVFWNLALVVPALVGYLPGSAISGALDDVQYLDRYELLLLWGFAILGANVCFCFAYALEFLYGSDEPQSRWLHYGRSMVFAVGTILGMFLAFQGGVAILRVEYGP